MTTAEAPATRTRRRPQFHPLKVARVERLTDDAVAVTFDVPAELAEDYRFKPGQALTLRRVEGDRDERRSYSICAPMGAAPRVGVREVPGGFFSSYLVHEVEPGDQIEVLPPSGAFTADLTRPADHVFVVAGSGITPALSLAATVLRDGESTVTVFYGNRRTNTVMFADELADLKDRYGTRLQLVHVLSREPRDAELTSGRLDGARLRTLIDNLVDAEHVDQEARQLIGLRRQRVGFGQPVRIVGEELGIVHLDHAGAGAGGRDHVVEAAEALDDALGEIARRAAVAGVVGGLAAAGLHGHVDRTAGVLEQLHGREADRGPYQVDEAGHEQADPAGRHVGAGY